jgi:hypothetical protein
MREIENFDSAKMINRWVAINDPKLCGGSSLATNRGQLGVSARDHTEHLSVNSFSHVVCHIPDVVRENGDNILISGTFREKSRAIQPCAAERESAHQVANTQSARARDKKRAIIEPSTLVRCQDNGATSVMQFRHAYRSDKINAHCSSQFPRRLSDIDYFSD